MKVISFAVPCYNSQAYMRHCIDSLLPAGDAAEIIIVNDGSSDSTAEIADEYAAKYPDIVRVIHQENGGHGEAVNAGLRNATGMYYKVVDSDDWLDGEALKKYIELLRDFDGRVDMLISNFVYEKQGARHKMAMRYADACPTDRIMGWGDLKHFRPGEVFLMHSLTYRTQLLRDCTLVLPKHTFYVDNLVAYLPLPYVKTIYYADIDLYRYFIGRNDQSVNLPIMIKRQDQQIEVVRRIIYGCKLSTLENERLARYMRRYLEIMMAVTSIILIKDGGEAALKKKQQIWKWLDEFDPEISRSVRHGIMGVFCSSDSQVVMWAAERAYYIANRIYGFN